MSYEEMLVKVENESYLTNCKKLEEILNLDFDDSVLENNEEFEMLYYSFIISKKYNKSYEQVLELSNKFLKIRNTFNFVYYKFYFLKTSDEIQNFINDLRNSNTDLTIRLLQKIIAENKIKNIVIFKKIFCELCIEIFPLLEFNIYQKENFIQKGLKLSKEMNEKELYDDLLRIDQQLKNEIFQSMGKTTFDFPKEVNESFTIIENQIRKTFSKMPNVEEYIKLFVNKFCIQVKDMIFIHSLSEATENVKDIVTREKSLVDLVSWKTYDGMKLVKAKKVEGMVEDSIRKIYIKIIINPMIEAGVSNLGKEKIIDYLCSSYFVFEEDRVDIEIALNAFFDGNYRTFIYYIIPNIEKILRNILEVNNIPTYQNSLSNPLYQTTLVLTDSLKKLEEEGFFDKTLVKLLNEKLNHPEFENYRNRLSHKLDNDIFCYDCASDLLRILIAILFCYENDDEYLNVFGEKKDVEELLFKLEQKNKSE